VLLVRSCWRSFYQWRTGKHVVSDISGGY